MRLQELLKMVLINIWSNKFRAFLTTLGIIVGAATIILVVAVGKGGQASVAEQFARLNVGTLYVMSTPGENVKVSLSPDDALAIRENAPSVQMAVTTVSGQAEMGYQGVSQQGSVMGAWPEYQELSNIRLKDGVFINTEDEKKRKRVAVVGANLAELLFAGDVSNALGQTITVNKLKFQVIGVMERLGDSMGGTSIDDSLVVPYIVAEKYLLGPNVKPRITVQAKDLESIPAAMEEITEVIRDTHRIKGSDDFVIRDAGSRLAAAQDSAKTMSVLLIIVAAIVLVVGGLGIMNVLFVTVKERTREIGILKAIGTRKRDILLQFLLEAVTISLLGGVLGSILGTLLTPLFGYFDLKAIPSISGVLLGLVFSIVTGTFFGYYPAMIAANLSPLEALRYE